MEKSVTEDYSRSGADCDVSPDKRWEPWSFLGVTLCAVAGVAGAFGGGGCEKAASPPTEVEVEVDRSALVSGAVNVSDGMIPLSDAESQTVAVGIGNFLAVAYNIFYDPIAEMRCSPLSQIGMSYYSGASEPFNWRGVSFAVPTGIAALRFTPSITYVDTGSNYTVYVSAVAYSTAVWPGYQPGAQNCISYDVYRTLSGDRLCVMTVNLPKNGATASVTSSNCFGESGANYYDTALTPNAGTVAPLVATWNKTRDTISFFTANGGLLNSPFPSQTMIGSPLFVKGSQTDLIAPDSTGVFWWTRYNRSSGTWSTPLIMSPAPSGYSWTNSISYGIDSNNQYTAVLSTGAFSQSAINLFYRSGSALVGWGRMTNGLSGIFQTFASRPGFDAFQPAAEVVVVPNELGTRTGYHPLLTYWDTSGPSGQLLMNWVWPSRSVVPVNGGSQVPCPVGDQGGYWGYRDDMAVRITSAGTPTFSRFFTDSTKTACTLGKEEFDSTTPPSVSTTPQHVSTFSFPVPAGTIDGGALFSVGPQISLL